MSDDEGEEYPEDAEEETWESSEEETWENSSEGLYAYFVFFSILLAVVLVLSKLRHDRPVIAKILPEAGLILLVGMAAGSIVNMFIVDEPGPAQADDDSAEDNVAESLLAFSPKVFFMVLLPPIIFNSGYHLRRELFFRQLLPICLFAVAGTLISALSTAFFLDVVVSAKLAGPFMPTLTELLTFGALISSTDPVSILAVFQAKKVDPHLFYLVFGESVLNDVVALVLFKTFAKFVVVPDENGAGKIVFGIEEFIFSFLLDAVGSPALGMFCGVATAVLFRFVDMRNSRLLELSLYVLIMYVPFLLAELVSLSGIVTILFTGMTARSFVVPNLSLHTAATAETLFRLAAHLAETAISLELGLSVFSLTQENFNSKFILWALLACLVARALNIYPITFVFNRTLQRDPNLMTNVNDGTEEGSNSSPHRKRKANQIEMTDALAASDHHQPETMYHYYPKQNQEDEDDLSSITPRKKRDLKIAPKTAHMLWFSGLRGAVAYACVRAFPDTFGHRNEFIATTMVIVLVTVFCLGSTTDLVLNCLKIDMAVDETKYMEEWHQQRKPHGMIRRFDAFVNTFAVRHPSFNIKRKQPSDQYLSPTPDADRNISFDKIADEPDPHQDLHISSSSRSLEHPHIPIEVLASRHFEDAEEMGYKSYYKKKESLFDFGGTDYLD